MSDDDRKYIRFTRAPAKHGDYYVFTIPNAMVKSGEIDPDMYYKIRLRPLKKKEVCKR